MMVVIGITKRDGSFNVVAVVVVAASASFVAVVVALHWYINGG